MAEPETVLCLCPTSRLALMSLVLSTWRNVGRCIVVGREPTAEELDEASVVVVMDTFASRTVVRNIAARRPVRVIAWNGLFEILRYQRELAGIDLVYMGPDEALEIGAYEPMIDGACAFARWRDRYRRKTFFEIRGDTEYRLRWLRTRLLNTRWLSVAAASAGAARRPRALRRTLESAVARDKLVWAGVCCLDPSIGLTREEEEEITAGLDEIRAIPDPTERLRAGLAMASIWRSRSTPERAHQMFYVTNTVLRWSVLGFLKETASGSTWFFGRDNLGLGLELELYVHNLVPTERIAFLELGGTKTGDALYPRALHLLARELYVISIPADASGDIAGMLEVLLGQLRGRSREFFGELETRRRNLYSQFRNQVTLAEAHRRVWNDFGAHAARAR